MAAFLTKSRVVLDLRVASSASDAQFVDETDDYTVYMPWDVFVDMDHPQQITVTVEPGDELNV